MSIVIFFIILLILVLVHEFGHFFTAKKFGIRVDEFGFGFPPKLFGRKYGETEYTLNLLPLGGFVKIFGEDPNEENINGLDASRSFVNKPKYQQAIVLFAGVFANFLLAWLFYSVGFMSGFPTSVGAEPAGSKLSDVHTVIVSIVPKSPAEVAGLKVGDKIFSIRNNKYSPSSTSQETIKSLVVESNNKEVEIAYIRGKSSEINLAKVTPKMNVLDGKVEIGISMDQIGIAKLPVFRAFWEGMKVSLFKTKNTVLGLYALIKEGIMGKGSFASITGPVGMVGIVGDAYKFGFGYLLSFSAFISINLAVINLIPFPALDGGRLFFLLIEKVKGSRMNPKVVNMANMIGFGILLFFMLVVTYHDVIKLF